MELIAINDIALYCTRSEPNRNVRGESFSVRAISTYIVIE